MGARAYFSHMLFGLLGAIVIHTLVQTLLWTFSLGRTLDDYLPIWFIWLPMPVLLGIFAGVIVSIVCRSQCPMWAFVLAAIGMISAMVSIAFGADGRADNSIISSIWRPVLSGATVELVVAAVARIGVYLFKRLRG